jgi:hypothetical protein
MNDSEKKFYTLFFKDGRTNVLPLTQEEVRIMVRKDDSLAFVIEGVTNRYIFVKGLWTVKKGRQGIL